MKNFLIFSRCLKKDNFYWFHFRGFYQGHKIKLIKTRTNLEIEVFNDYLLWVHEISIRDEILEVKVIKIKKIH